MENPSPPLPCQAPRPSSMQALYKPHPRRPFSISLHRACRPSASDTVSCQDRTDRWLRQRLSRIASPLLQGVSDSLQALQPFHPLYMQVLRPLYCTEGRYKELPGSFRQRFSGLLPCLPPEAPLPLKAPESWLLWPLLRPSLKCLSC